MIYFDHNATTPVDARVVEAMLPYLTKFYGNPSSLHRPGRAVRTAIETAREQVANLVGASSAQVIFTSGGTESNNLAFATARQSFAPGKVLVGATEHPAVMEPAEELADSGWQLALLPVDGEGLIDTESFQNCLTEDTRLISVMLANNETGVIQNIAALSGMIASRDLLFHTDAVQACGKIAVDFSALGVHLMSLSAHKIYGPKGVGALIFDKRVDLRPLQRGGGQEQTIRSGTENTAGIVGFGLAAELAKAELQSRSAHLRMLRQSLEQNLRQISGLEIVAQSVDRIPNTTQIICPGIDGEMLLMQLDQQGIAVSSGSACASNNREPSPVLMAMGYDRYRALSAIRISLGQNNTLEEVERFGLALREITSGLSNNR